MPRSYSRKTSRAASYTKENLRLAVEKVRAGELSNYAASVMYGIPKSTLNDRVLGKTGVVSKTLGRPPALSSEIEINLAKCLCTLEKWGWGLSRYEVLDIISKYIKTNKIKTPFKNDRPGPDWFIAFKKRNNLSIKKPQPVEYLRKRMTNPFVIQNYFSLLKKTLNELNLDDPNQIWNLDETSVALDPTKTKVVGGIGKPCTRTTAGTGKENITVLTTVNAAGRKLNPLIVYKGKHVYQQWLAEEKEYGFEIAYAASKRGWMETDIFFNYMKKIVIPCLGEKRPVLMIYGGHTTHVNPEVIELAIENTILKLPAHTSHLLQPLDLAVFKSFKSIWDRKLIEWQRKNVGIKLRKQAFAEIFAETWYLTNPKVIQNGFKKGGIYPFNENVIPVEKYDPQAYKKWKDCQKKLKQVRTLHDICLEIINRNLGITTNSHPKSNDSGETMTFEELLLNKLSQHNASGNKNLTKLKRVAKGAEVITLKILEKNKETGKAVVNKQNESDDNKNPRPSNRKTTIKKKNKTINNFDKTSTGKEETNSQKTITHTDSKFENTNTEQKTKTILNSNKTSRDEEVKNLQKIILRTDSQLNNTNKKQKKEFLNNSDKTSQGKEEKIYPQKIDTQTDSPDHMIPGPSKLSTVKNQKNKTTLNSERTSEGKKKTEKEKNITQTDYLDDKNPIPAKLKNTVKKTTKRKTKRKMYTIKTKRHPGGFTDSTTSESADISTHSDSDIIDLSDLDLSDIDLNKNVAETKEIDQNYDIGKELLEGNELYKIVDGKENEELKDDDYDTKTSNQKYDTIDLPSTSFVQIDNTPKNKVTILSSIRFKPENSPFVGLEAFESLNLTKIDQHFDISRTRKRKSSTRGKENVMSKRVKDISHEKNQRNEEYGIGDKVLVRYYTTIWKYYVGVIESIYVKPIKYNIYYYKSVGKKENIKFTVPKRKDYDAVPENSIVKKIELLQVRENPDEYTLMNDEDAVYFT